MCVVGGTGGKGGGGESSCLFMKADRDNGINTACLGFFSGGQCLFLAWRLAKSLMKVLSKK